MKSQFKNIDQKNIDTIKNIIEHIQLLQKQLSENYFQNYSAVNEELIKIREQTTLLISSPLYGQTLKIYAQRLIGYVNKYRNEHDEIEKSLNLAEGFYKKGEYQNTIEQMIETVSTILTSAKESKISFN
jgi:septation ring formation regulator EzrA